MGKQHVFINNEFFSMSDEYTKKCVGCEFEHASTSVCSAYYDVCSSKTIGVNGVRILTRDVVYTRHIRSSVNNLLLKTLILLNEHTHIYTKDKDIQDQLNNMSLLYIQVKNFNLSDGVTNYLKKLSSKFEKLGYIPSMSVINDELTIKYQLDDTKIKIIEAKPICTQSLGSIGYTENGLQIVYNGMQQGSISHTMQPIPSVLQL